jgi:hypothetical protein
MENFADNDFKGNDSGVPKEKINSLESFLRVLRIKISMESKTFARTSARRYRIVDTEERFMLNF